VSSHLAVADKPIGAIRPLELGITGIQGRRANRRSELRMQVRAALLRPVGRHRVTFIPLDTYSLHAD
jgi:hypothetical protein